MPRKSKDSPYFQALQKRRRCLQTVPFQDDAIYGHLSLALTGTSIAHQICADAGFGLRTSPVFFLEPLTRTFWAQHSMEWKHGLVSFALALIYLQRAERLASHGRNLPER